MMILRTTFLAALLYACGSAPPPTPMPAPSEKSSTTSEPTHTDPWTLRKSEKPKLLRGKLGRVLRMVPVQSEAVPTGAYLLQTEGFRGKNDGMVFLALRTGHPLRTSTEGFGYRVNLHGQPAVMLMHNLRRGYKVWEHEWDLRVEHDKESIVDGEALIALHYEQIESGALAEVSPSDREGRIRAQDELFHNDASEAAQACGVPMSIRWESVKDQWFDEFRIASLAARYADVVKNFCEEYPHLLPEIQKIGRVEFWIRGRSGSVKRKVTRAKDALIVEPGDKGEVSVQVANAFFVELENLFGEADQVLRLGDRYIVLKSEGERVLVYAGKKDSLIPQFPALSTSIYSRKYLPMWAGGIEAELRRAAGKWSLRCGESVQEPETLVGPEREQLLKTATFASEALWKYEPYFLGRDSRGVYYYVDKYRKSFGGGHHRVFVGRRGQAQLTKLEGLVEDSQGMVFSTKKGNLRLIIDGRGTTKEATWIRGKKHSDLTTVPVHRNQKLVYQSLGAYFGERLGDVCEE